MERTLLTAVLTHTEGNQSKAADILGITRGSLRNKIRLLGINIERKVNLEEGGSVDPVPAKSSSGGDSTVDEL
jgi:hypothetical protein